MVYDKAHIALVDPHAKGNSRHNDLDLPCKRKVGSVSAKSCCAGQPKHGLSQMKSGVLCRQALPLLH